MPMSLSLLMYLVAFEEFLRTRVIEILIEAFDLRIGLLEIEDAHLLRQVGDNAEGADLTVDPDP